MRPEVLKPRPEGDNHFLTAPRLRPRRADASPYGCGDGTVKACYAVASANTFLAHL